MKDNVLSLSLPHPDLLPSEDPMIRLTTMDQVEAHISRCNVCMGPSLVQTVHSFSTDIPNCPIGFEQIWAG